MHSQERQDDSNQSDIATFLDQQQQQPTLNDTMQAGLEHMYQPVAALCNRGKHKAQQLQQDAEASAADAVDQDTNTAPAQPDHAAAASDETQPEAPASGDGHMKDRHNGQSTTSSSSSRVETLLDHLLSGLRSAAVKSLAEVSAGQLMALLALGRSVAATPR